MNRKKIFKHIEEHFDDHLKRLQELVRQPSISAENLGIRDCANLIKDFSKL
ncbi:MAG: hypothetical protein ACPLZC_06280 [Candidatus Bathyarchaeales archaeon]